MPFIIGFCVVSILVYDVSKVKDAFVNAFRAIAGKQKFKIESGEPIIIANTILMVMEIISRLFFE
jgi:hypothetical protein